MGKITQDHIQALARSSVSEFFRYLQPRINPTHPIKADWYLDAMGEAIMGLWRDDYTRLMVNAPPRSSKTTLCTIYTAAFILGRDPMASLMIVSYGDELSRDMALKVEALLKHRTYRTLFPHTKLNKDKSRAHLFITSQGGSMRFTSLNGVMTGIGADWIIIDDPLQAAHVRSEARSDAVVQVFRESLSTRLNNPTSGKILLVQQRLSPSDLCGSLTEAKDHVWRVLALPAEFMEEQSFDLGPLRGWHSVKVGDLLAPDHLTREVLQQRRREMGEAAYQAQYLQHPIFEQDNPVDFTKIKTIKQHDYAALGADLIIVQSWDTALTAHESSDYSAVTTWARVSKEQYILLNVTQFKVPSDQLVDKIASHAQAWRSNKVYIEEANHAVDLIRLVQAKLTGQAQVYGERHNNQSKMDRLEAVLFLINSGFIYFIEGDASAQILLHQLRRFPHGRHDDCVDSFTQALKVMRKSSGRPYWRIS